MTPIATRVNPDGALRRAAALGAVIGALAVPMWIAMNLLLGQPPLTLGEIYNIATLSLGVGAGSWLREALLGIGE